MDSLYDWSDEKTSERIKSIVAKSFRVSKKKVNLESNFKKDLGADSGDLIVLKMHVVHKLGLNEQFNNDQHIAFSNAWEGFQTVGCKDS